ncbi:baseplate J/gp47 family protein [Enterobacter hormaechei]|nr:baseplate J/gp47 family protein [Enterobacter hormaechei]
MFQLKNFVSIAASMLNYVRSTTGKVTDLQPGSVTRTILEAPAAELEELYIQMFNGIKDAIPVAVFNSFQFDRLPPQYASGLVTIIATQPVASAFPIPKGTRFLSRDGRAYQSLGDMEWPLAVEAIPGDPSSAYPVTSVNVPVIAVQAGSMQNAVADEINSSPLFPPDRFKFTSSAMTNGKDMESDEQRVLRFSDYIGSLSRGTETALLYAARYATLTDSAGNITESVTRTSLTVNTGSVTVNVWGSNGAPSAELLARITQLELGYKDASGAIVPGYAAAGISCSVAAMYEEVVNADITLTFFSSYSADQAMRQNIRNVISSFLAGVQPGEFVYADDLQGYIQTVRGVQSASVKMSGNIECQANEVLSMGTIRFVNVIKADFMLTLTSDSAITTAIQEDVKAKFNAWVATLTIGSEVSAKALIKTLTTAEPDGTLKPTTPGLDAIAVTLPNGEFTVAADDLISAGMATYQRQER